MKTWFTADWHLGEDNFRIRQRPFKSAQEQLDVLVSKHNALVDATDKVIMIGDAVNQRTPEHLEHVSLFNGRKILIRGNHDRVFSDTQLLKYFYCVIDEGDGLEIQCGDHKCWATHYPSEAREDMFNLVGHVHSAWKVQLNMLNVGVDVHYWCPIDSDEVVFQIEACNKHYDDDIWAAYYAANMNFKGKRGKPGNYYVR